MYNGTTSTTVVPCMVIEQSVLHRFNTSNSSSLEYVVRGTTTRITYMYPISKLY